MTARDPLQLADILRRNTEPSALLGVANALFDRQQNPREYPRIFYIQGIGSLATPIVAQLMHWREGPTLAYAARMFNGTVHVGKHLVVPRTSPRAPKRPGCSSQIYSNCVEYVMTSLGVCGAHDWDKTGICESKDWDELELYNGLGAAAQISSLEATDVQTDFFSASAACIEQAAATFATHLPAIMQNAITQVRAARQSAGG